MPLDITQLLFGALELFEHGTEATAVYTRLVGDAEDSPVTDDAGDPNQFFGGILVVYKWR